MSCTRSSSAAPTRTSINHICKTTDDSPHTNTVRGHLIDQFDLDTAKQVGNTLLQRDPLDTLFLLNSWRYLHWRYGAAPRRGGRRLWRWPFAEFCEMLTRAVWTALGVRRVVPANQPLDDRFIR